MTQHTTLAGLFRALADPHRLLILQLLHEKGAQSVTDLGELLGQSQPAVSHHLSQLREANLVQFERAGKFNMYRVNADGLRHILQLLSDGLGKWLIGDNGSIT